MKMHVLEVKKNSKELHTVILKVFFLFVVFATIYNLFFGQFNLLKTLELKRSLMEIENKKLQMERENAKLERLLNSIERNPEYYKEIFIREYMQLQREGEKIILFYD